ncbi:hypothetical protein KKA47_04705, partial [bacterium]|nr:hypothetical protein [bacterium]
MYFAGDDTKVPVDISGKCFFIDQENQSQEEVACPVDNVPNKGMAHVFTVGEGEEYNCSVFDIDTMTEIQGCQPATRAQLFKPEAPVIAAPSPSPKADPKAEDPKPAGPIVEGAIKCVYDLVGSLVADKSKETCPISVVPGECTEGAKGCEPEDAKHSAQIKGEIDTMAASGYAPIRGTQIRDNLYYDENTNVYYFDPHGMIQASKIDDAYYYFLETEYYSINIDGGITVYAPLWCEGYVGLKEQFTDAVWDEREEDAGIIIGDEFFKLDEGCQKENLGTDEAPVWLYFADPSFGELVRIKEIDEPWPQIINSEGNIYSVNGQLYRI